MTAPEQGWNNQGNGMRKLGLAVVLAFAYSGSFGQAPTPVVVPVIEIKGIKFGMSKVEVEAITGTYSAPKEFTIGGVSSKYKHSGPSTGYINDKLSRFMLIFEPSQFSQVRDAVESKYPALKCQPSEVKNRMGASFSQVECTLTSPDGNLSLNKYGSDITSGYLSMVTQEEVERFKRERQKKANDI